MSKPDSSIAVAALVLMSVLAGTLRCQPPPSEWRSELALDVGTRLGACAVGDVLPERSGPEIVAACADGRIFAAYRTDDGWRHRVLTRVAGEPLQVAVGDLDPGVPGDEILVVGSLDGMAEPGKPGAATLVSRTAEGEFGGHVVARGAGPLRAVCIVSGVGFIAGDDGSVRQLQVSDSGVESRVVAEIEEPVRDMLATHDGLALASGSGALVLVVPSRSDPPAHAIARMPNGLPAIGTDGVRVLVADGAGGLFLIQRDAWQGLGGWSRQSVLEGSEPLGGVVLADLEPELPGLEAAAASRSGDVTLFRERGNDWTARKVFQAREPLSGLVADNVDLLDGIELLTWGDSGCLFVLRKSSVRLIGPQAGEWVAEVALDSGVGLGGCATGDLDPRHPGLEIAVVGRDGAVRQVARDASGWHAETLHVAPGELIQVAIGEADPESPGLEIVAVGMAEGRERRQGGGAVVVVRRGAGGWVGETVLETPALQHGVCVADGEVFVTGYDNAVHRIRRQRGEWIAEKIADLPGAGKNIILVSGMLVVSSTDGSLVGIERDGTTWSARVLDKRDRGRSRLGTDGRRVLVSDDDGLLSIVTPSEDGRSWSREEIHREFDRERGAVLADLDPDTPGLEVATAGYEFRITLLREADGAWWSKLLFRDSERFHHLAAGDVDGEPGIELVGCGYSGRVTVLRRVGR